MILQYDIGNPKDFNDQNINETNQMSCIGVFQLPPVEGNMVFYITSTMMHLIQLKGLFTSLAHEDPHEYIKNIVDVCGPFSFKNIISRIFLSEVVPFLSNVRSMQVVG